MTMPTNNNIEPDYGRQHDIVSPQRLEALQVTVIGVGGIGSPTTLALSKMGVENITVYDNDKIEAHNFPNQMYRLFDFGKHKTDCLKEICQEFTGIEIVSKPEKYVDQKLKGLVVSGVDSMEARKTIWEKIKYNPAVDLYIDGRMGGETAIIYTVKPCDPDSVREYEKTLHSDEESAEIKCTAKAIIYNVFMIASLIASQVKKYVMGEGYPWEIIFDFKTMTFLTRD